MNRLILCLGLFIPTFAGQLALGQQANDFVFKLSDGSQFVRTSPKQWWVLQADGEVREKPMEQVSLGNERPIIVRDSYHGNYEYRLDNDTLKMRAVGQDNWGNYFYNITGKLTQTGSPAVDQNSAEPGSNALVSVEFRNPVEPTKVFLVDASGEEEWLDIPAYQSTRIDAYPANRFIFKQERSGTWQAIDEFLVGDLPQQTHVISEDNRLLQQLVDGRQVVLRRRYDDKPFLIYATNGAGKAKKPHFRIGPADAGAQYEWIAHRVLDADVDGWAFELLATPGKFLGVPAGTSLATSSRSPELMDLRKNNQGKIEFSQIERSRLLRATWHLKPPVAERNGQFEQLRPGLGMQNAWIQLHSIITGNPQCSWMGGDSFGFLSGYELKQFTVRSTGLFPVALDVVPWGKDAAVTPVFKVTPSRSYAGWLRDEQPLNPSTRSTISGSLSDGFVGRLLSNEVHSLSGYNVLYLNPFNLQEHGQESAAELMQIFKPIDPNATESYYLAGDYRIPNCFYFLPAKESRMEESTSFYFSENELQKSMSFSVGIKGQAGNPEKSGAKLGGSGSWSEKRRKVTTENRVARIKTKWESDFWLTIDKRFIKLDPAFVRFLLDPRRKFDSPHDFDELFRKYGTHYPLSALYGGRFVEEAFIEGRSVMNSIETTLELSGQAEGTSKKGGGGVQGSYSTGSFEASKSEERQENVSSHSAGGSGLGEMWTKGDSSNFAPIKVDLRPISEILRPELIEIETLGQKLTAADIAKIDMIRSKSYAMLDRYLREEGQASDPQDKTPQMFVVSIDSIKCIRADDALNVSNHAPDIIGRIELGSARRHPGRWEFRDGEEDVTLAVDIPSDQERSLDKNQSMNEHNGEPFAKHTFGVRPVSVQRQVQSQLIHVWDYDFENEFVWINCYLDDNDNSGTDPFRLSGEQGTAYPLICLAEVASEKSKLKTFYFKPEHPSAGQLEIAVTVRMVDIQFSEPDTMPRAPYEPK